MFVCKVCKEKYSTLEGLYSHLEEEHSSLIPPDMTTAHYYYYLKTGRKHGNCVMCKGPTEFNEKTKKYHRFCDNPKCKQDYKDIVDKRMIGVYGKVNLLNDSEQQRKMLMNRSISGHYNFNGVDKPYVGSYELDFLKTMDLFFDWDPNDIVSPSPHTYYYEYEGTKHFYIPDFYIMSLGLEIEVKDGGDNPNMHHKIQDVDKEKEKLKDKVMHTQNINHYVKLTNKNYYNLFEFFRISKEYVEKYGDYEKIPKIILDEDIRTKKVVSKNQIKQEANKAVNENYEPVNEKFELDKFLIWFEKPISKLKNGNIRLYHGSSVDIKERIITPISINVGATRMSTPRWSTYFWDNLEMAIQWAITWEVQETMKTRCLYRNHDGKSLLVNNSNLSDEKFIDKILKAKPTFYIYETIVPIKKLEMGSTGTIPEYTVSETVKIVKKTKIKVDRNMIYTYFTILSREEFDKIVDDNDVNYISRYRNRVVSLFLDNRRDPYRSLIKKDIKLDKIKIGDDISNYRRKINDAMDVNLLGLNESCELIGENYLFSKDDICINFEKFESGKSNVCLITGYSGSGKSTLGRQIAKEYDAYYIELDMFHRCDEMTDEINAKAGHIFSAYFNKDKHMIFDIYPKIRDRKLSQKELCKEFKKFFKFTLSYCEKYKHERFVIEGVQIFELNDGNKLKKYPIIIKNTSMLKSMGRMMRRDKNEILDNGKGGKNYFNYVKYAPKFLKWYMQNEKDFTKFKNDVQEESYVCFPLLNSIISSNYTDVKSKAQYKKDVESFKHHFLQGIKDIQSLDDAKAMKSDLIALNSYLHDIKYTNKYSEFKNLTAVKEIEGWMTNTAMPQIDEIIKKYEKTIEPVNEYAHTITFALNNKLNRGLYGLMDSVSSIIIDNDIQIQRRNGIMSISESVELNDDTNNISFGTDADIKLKDNNISYLIWNRNQGENILLENFIKDWLLSVNVDSFHKIEGGDD